MTHFYRGNTLVIREGDPTTLSTDALILGVNRAPTPRGGPEERLRAHDNAAISLELDTLRGTGSELRVIAAEGLAARWLILVPLSSVSTDAYDRVLSDLYDEALRQALSLNVHDLALVLLRPGQGSDLDASIALGAVHAALDAHPFLERVTLCATSELELALLAAAADEYC